MRNSVGLTKLVAAWVVVATCGTFFSGSVAAAERYRSFYQNSGANCHGKTNANNDNQIKRTAQSLQNDTTTKSLTVVCNLMTDGYATFTDNYGTVTSAIIWYRNLPGNTTPVSCSMTTGYGGYGGSQLALSPTGTVLPTGTYQGYFEWVAPANARYVAPINVECTLPPKTELNDWLVEYIEDIGDGPAE